MIILSQDGSVVVNSKNVASFFVNVDNTGTPCLAASVASGEPGIVLGKYNTVEETKKELQALFRMIVSENRVGQESYQIQ